MHSFSFSNPQFLALLQPGAPTVPPVPAVFTFADSGADGLETNMTLVGNYSRGTSGNNTLFGTGAGLFVSLIIPTTQFRLYALQQPDGSDFVIIIQDSSGLELKRSTASCYAATSQDSALAYDSGPLPADTYAIRVETLNSGGGALSIDAIAYAGTARPLPFLRPGVAGTESTLSATAGQEQYRVKDGMMYYGFAGSYAKATPPGQLTRLQVRAPLVHGGATFTVTVVNAAGTLVDSTTGTCGASPEQVSTIVYDSGPLPPDTYTITYAHAGGGTLVLDVFYYQPA